MARPKREVRILAKSLYRHMKAHGFGRIDVIHFTTALLDLLTSSAAVEAGQRD